MIETVRKVFGKIRVVTKVTWVVWMLVLLVLLLVIVSKGIFGFEDRNTPVEAIVSEINKVDGDYSVVVSYQYQDEYYSDCILEMDYLPDDMKVGENYTLYVAPDKPYKPIFNYPSWLAFLIFFIPWLLLVLCIIFKAYPRERKEKIELPYGLKNGNPKLKEKGEPIKARVIDYGKTTEETDGVVRVQYYVIVDYIDSKRVLHKAGTGYIDFNPTQYIKDKNKEIIVYINPKRPSKCYIDVEEMYEYLQLNRAYTYDTSN